MDKREVNNLVREIARGDVSAAEKLYGLMKVPLLSFVAPYCADFSEREDVVQAVFLKVIQKSPSLVFFTDCFAWMFRVAKNECFDRARKRRLLPAEGPREEEGWWNSNTLRGFRKKRSPARCIWGNRRYRADLRRR